MDRTTRPRPRSKLARAVALALGASIALGSSLALAGPPDPNRSRELFRKAAKEYEQGKTRAAYEDYLAAWEIQRSYDIAGNLANVELDLGMPRAAAEHATYAIANFPPVGTEKQRTFLQGLLRDAKKQVGALSIRVSEPSAAVTLDGTALPAAALADELFVDPGEHTVVAEAAGFEAARQTIRAERGASLTVTLTLARPTKIEPPPLPPARGLGPVVVGGVIATGVATGLGITFAVLSTSKAGDADAQQKTIASSSRSPNACGGAHPPAACVDLHDLRKSRDAFANASVWTFVGASALGVGTLVYGLVSARPAAEPRAVSIRFAPTLGGAVLEGSF